MNQKPSKPDRAWKLLSKRGAWIQEAEARDKNGFACFPYDEEAACFCPVGALIRVYGPIDTFDRKVDKVFRRVRKLGFDSISGWNDHPSRKKSEVVALLKEVDV